MFRYVKKHDSLVAFALIFILLTEITIPLSAIFEQRIVDYIVEGDIDHFIHMLGYVAIVVLGSVVGIYMRSIFINKFTVIFTEELRNDLYDGIMRRSLYHFNSKDTAEYLSIIENDVTMVTNNYSSPIFLLIGSGISIILSLIVMILYSPLLAGIAVCCSVFSFFIPLFITKYLKRKLVEKSKFDQKLTIELKEAFHGHEVITTFGVAPWSKQRFRTLNHSLTTVNFKTHMLISALENSSSVVGRFMKLITYLIAGYLTIQGKISVGTMILFFSIYSYFSSNTMVFSQVVPLLKGTKPVYNKLFNLIDEKENSFLGTIEPTFQNELQVRDLSFQYVSDVPVLTNLSLEIKKGEKIALLGSSGCGKSTLIHCISGDYQNYSGNIFYDEVELKQLNTNLLHKMMAVIHQNTFIFNDSIRNNICMGECFSEEQVEQTLKLSGIDQFISSIPDGIDGNCGENGANLSGGQKQRIALARALIRGVDFLILDEGVSAIDVATANEIERELLSMKDLTLLTITHRIKDGLLEDYDRVLSMCNGRIILKEQ